MPKSCEKAIRSQIVTSDRLDLEHYPAWHAYVLEADKPSRRLVCLVCLD